MNIRPALESEKTVLGGLLLVSSMMPEVEAILCPDDFSCCKHHVIFDAMKIVFNKRGTFDVAMISDVTPIELNDEYLYKLANDCCSTANIIAHAKIVREKSVQRALLKSSCFTVEKDDLHNNDCPFSLVESILKATLLSPEERPQDTLAKYLELEASYIREGKVSRKFYQELLCELSEAIIEAIDYFKRRLVICSPPVISNFRANRMR